MPDLPRKRSRFGECSKFVPVVFVSFAICTLYFIFVYCNLLPGLRSGEHRTHEIVKAAIFHLITALLVACYVRSILTHPGEIPDNDPQWEFMSADSKKPRPPESQNTIMALNLQEIKRSGHRRNCKWCNKYKPDRAHHCRICRTCILKMDHHCPWIYNCVGFKNYKYFFLLLLYTAADNWFIVAHMTSSVRLCVLEPDTPFVRMFLCLFGWTLAAFLGVLSSLFWGFHVWLSAKAMTTVEFCEKHLPKKRASQGKQSYDNYNSAYNFGPVGNLKATLGDNVFCMLLPLGNPSGTGLDFVSAEMRLTKDMEVSRGVRRIGHQNTQRSFKPLWPPLLDSEPPSSVSLEEGLKSAPNRPTLPDVGPFRAALAAARAAPPRAARGESEGREASQGLLSTVPPRTGAEEVVTVPPLARAEEIIR